MFAGFLGFGEEPVWCGGAGHTGAVHEEWNDHAGIEEKDGRRPTLWKYETTF